MPTTTVEVALNSAGWTLLAENVVDALVQMKDESKPFRVYVGAADPGAGVIDGVVLSNAAITTLPLPNLTSGTDQVYGRAIGADALATVLRTT